MPYIGCLFRFALRFGLTDQIHCTLQVITESLGSILKHNSFVQILDGDE